MLALRINFTDVELREFVPKSLQDCYSLAHCRINLPSMPQVAAKSSLWECFEDHGELLCCLSDSLSLIHVLDAKQLSKTPPQRNVIHRIRMHDDWPTAFRDHTQQVHCMAL